MGRVPAEYLRERYERATQRLLENMPLMAQAGESSVDVLAMSAGEIVALESVGLSLTPWEEGAEKDPLMQSIGDFMALIETSYTTREAAKYLGVDASRIRQRLREHSLFGIDYQGKKRLPRFQFERGQVIPEMGKVLAALPKDLNPLDVAEWFLSPNTDLEVEDEELSPREWLVSGREVAAVVALARGLG
jgi:hypothetical protein